jgi:hypothetical protein
MGRIAIRVHHALLALTCLAFANAALADDWMSPVQVTIESPAGTARVTITPGGLARQESVIAGREPGARDDATDRPTAHVEVRGAGGAWTTRWRGPLVNAVAPVAALVADDGAHLVTFDNWHAMGFGDDVLVVYDATGSVLHARSLEQLLPAAYVARLPRSISSIWWREKDPQLVDGGRTLLIHIVAPGAAYDGQPRRTVPLLVGLADGKPLAKQQPEWHAALRSLD